MKLSFDPSTDKFIVSEVGKILSTHDTLQEATVAMNIAIEPDWTEIKLDAEDAEDDDTEDFSSLLE